MTTRQKKGSTIQFAVFYYVNGCLSLHSPLDGATSEKKESHTMGAWQANSRLIDRCARHHLNNQQISWISFAMTRARTYFSSARAHDWVVAQCVFPKRALVRVKAGNKYCVNRPIVSRAVCSIAISLFMFCRAAVVCGPPSGRGF